MSKERIDWKREVLNKIKSNVKKYKWECIEYDTIISSNIFGNDNDDEKERVVIRKSGVNGHRLNFMGMETTSKEYIEIKEIYDTVWNMHLEEERRKREEEERKEEEQWKSIYETMCEKKLTKK